MSSQTLLAKTSTLQKILVILYICQTPATSSSLQYDDLQTDPPKVTFDQDDLAVTAVTSSAESTRCYECWDAPSCHVTTHLDLNLTQSIAYICSGDNLCYQTDDVQTTTVGNHSQELAIVKTTVAKGCGPCPSSGLRLGRSDGFQAQVCTACVGNFCTPQPVDEQGLLDSAANLTTYSLKWKQTRDEMAKMLKEIEYKVEEERERVDHYLEHKFRKGALRSEFLKLKKEMADLRNKAYNVVLSIANSVKKQIADVKDHLASDRKRRLKQLEQARFKVMDKIRKLEGH